MIRAIKAFLAFVAAVLSLLPDKKAPTPEVTQTEVDQPLIDQQPISKIEERLDDGDA